jgi:hypothetical protein
MFDSNILLFRCGWLEESTPSATILWSRGIDWPQESEKEVPHTILYPSKFE